MAGASAGPDGRRIPEQIYSGGAAIIPHGAHAQYGISDDKTTEAKVCVHRCIGASRASPALCTGRFPPGGQGRELFSEQDGCGVT